MDNKTVIMNSTLRLVYLAAGWISVGLGTVGAFVPVMPTTCFMIAALFFFSKSSPALENKLLRHPRYGATLRMWVAHSVIPVEIKVVAVTSLMISAAIVAATVVNMMMVVGVIATLALVAFYILTRPSLAPLTAKVRSSP